MVSNTFVVAMGISVVFIGLICLVIVCKILGVLCQIRDKGENTNQPVTAVSQPTAVSSQAIVNKQEILAAVCAAASEDMGTDVSALRVLSFKKI